MRKFIYLFIYLFIINSCKEEKKISKMENSNLYGVNYEFLVPSKIMINDMILDVDMQKGIFGPEFINQYIIKNGIQKVHVKLVHPFVERGGEIPPKKLQKLDDDLRIDLVDIKKDYQTTLVKKLDFPEIQQPIPFIEYEWEFEAELPFELEGWKNSQDLTIWDENELEKEVVAKFNLLRNILNSGNGGEFVKELEFANKEYFISEYFDENQKNEYRSNLIEQYGYLKGLIPPIENYSMRIMGDGKVVALETLGKYIGQGILTTENKEEGSVYQIYVMLHIPKGKKEFEIVRINAEMTSLDE